MMRAASSQKMMVAAAVILMVVACASTKQRRQLDAPQPTTARAAPPPPGMAVAGQPLRTPAVPECRQVLSCYTAMAGDLCLAGEDKCYATFRITTPVDKPETCKRLLEQADETAKPFMAGKRYALPQECS